MAGRVSNYEVNKTEYKIKNLFEYLSLIKELKQDVELIYRGKSQKYPSINGSIFRKHNFKNKKIDLSLYQEKILRDFYREMVASIKDLDRENFLAYSQHYGLPTSLVDITLSPLISLYFACSNEPDEDGFVYIFNKKETIDISEIVLKNPYINGEHLSFEKGNQFIIYLMDQMHSEVFFPVEKLFINLITFINKNTITPAYENICSRIIKEILARIPPNTLPTGI